MAQRCVSTSNSEMPLESGQPDQAKCRHLRAAAAFVKLPFGRMMDDVTGSRNTPESTPYTSCQAVDALMDATILELFFCDF